VGAGLDSAAVTTLSLRSWIRSKEIERVFPLILPTRLLWVEEREEAAEAAATDQLDEEGVGAGRRTRQFQANVPARWAHVLR
jgi:hypothetical protein